MKEDKNKNTKWTLFVDLKSAFYKVDHRILMRKMRKMNIQEDLINTIEWLYEQTKIQVKKEDINIGVGVIQGGVISPTLFLIMFNDLIEKLTNLGYEVFAYADDLAIVGIGDEKLRDVIKIVEDWTVENKMEINKKKSGIMIHNRNNLAKRIERKENIEGFPIVKEYKYLGIIIDCGLTFEAHLQYIEQKTEKARRMLKVMKM